MLLLSSVKYISTFIFQAKRVFEKICPGEEFLPKAPNPEDIIYDDGETGAEKETGFEPNGDTAVTTDCDGETVGVVISAAADAAEGGDEFVVADSSTAASAVTDDTTARD